MHAAATNILNEVDFDVVSTKSYHCKLLMFDSYLKFPCFVTMQVKVADVFRQLGMANPYLVICY